MVSVYHCPLRRTTYSVAMTRWSALVGLWIAVGLLSLASVSFPTQSASATASATAQVPGMCRLDAVAVQTALGVNSSEKYEGPHVFLGGACSWRTTDPTCFLRVLSVQTHATGSQRLAVKKLLAAAQSFDLAPNALGKNAFFARTDLGAGAAIDIERLYVPRGRDWVEVTLSGRLGVDGSHDLLVIAANGLPRRLAA